MLALRLSCLLAVVALGCGSAQHSPGAAGAPAPGSDRIEQRTLSDRPALAVIEREGDPEAAISFASSAASSPDTHAALGELLLQRLLRGGFQAELYAHALGFELTLIGAGGPGAAAALNALLQALQKPVAQNELSARPSKLGPERAPSVVDQCSGKLASRRPPSDVAELERERSATFARDRSAIGVVGNAAVIASVSEALSAGPEWPEQGVVRSVLPTRNTTQLLTGERGNLAVALTVPSADQALAAQDALTSAESTLRIRLPALGGGLGLATVQTAVHRGGACLRVDAAIDATPLPDARRVGFAIQLIEEELASALRRPAPRNRLGLNAVSAVDPREGARIAAYRALLESDEELPAVRLVGLTAPDSTLAVASIDAAIEAARATAVNLETQARVEQGQPGTWALAAFPCAAASERDGNSGHAAVFLSAVASRQRRRVRLEPWVGSAGAGLVGFAQREAGESDADAAARLGDVLGEALFDAPDPADVASARTALLKATGSAPRPLLGGLLEALAPGHVGALLPRGDALSLQAASPDAIAARQRALLRSLPRLAVITPGGSGDAAFTARSLGRWFKTPDAMAPSPCSTEIGPAARSELSLPTSAEAAEGSYLGFRIAPKFAAEAALLAELLNLPGGALSRSLAEPELIGAARAQLFGTGSARALVVQVSAFEGRETEALSRLQKLFERLASGGLLTAAEIDAAVNKRRSAVRLSTLDPRHRLVQLLDPTPLVSDATALRRFTALLRPESAIVARGVPRPSAPSAGKSPATR